jgi:hypothetical protein
MIKPSSGTSFKHWKPHLQRYSNYSFVIKLEMTAYMEKTLALLNLMSVCPCIVDDMKRGNQLNATQWFIELMIRSTCFGHYYAHHQDLETMQMITACGT